MIGDVTPDARTGDDADQLGPRRRQSDRDAARQAARGLLGLTDAGTTLSNAYLKVDTLRPGGAGIVGADDPVPRHRRPLHPQRRDGRRHALLERHDRDDEPGRDAPRRRRERRSGGGLHLRSRPLGRLHAPGQPGWVGQDRDGVVRIRPDDLFFGAKAGDVQPDWLDTTRSRSPRPTSSSGCSRT